MTSGRQPYCTFSAVGQALPNPCAAMTSAFTCCLCLYKLIQSELLSTSVLVFIMVSALYWLEHIFVPNQNKELHPGTKIHLGVLIGFVVLFVVWEFLVHRFSLLYTDSHEPVLYGPSTIEIRYQLPLIWLGIFSFLAMAVTAGVYIFSDMHCRKTPFFISLATFLVILGLPHVAFIPNFIAIKEEIRMIKNIKCS